MASCQLKMGLYVHGLWGINYVILNVKDKIENRRRVELENKSKSRKNEESNKLIAERQSDMITSQIGADNDEIISGILIPVNVKIRYPVRAQTLSRMHGRR